MTASVTAPAVEDATAAWLIDAADLLTEPDPGPTPWLVEGLMVDQALIAAVGRWKTTKSYALLDVCISVATGRPAFGHLAVPEPGPVVFINEESGRRALHRRLDALCRGRAIDPDELRGRLHLAANAGIKLDDYGWQERLVELGRTLKPRLFVFDPLARMKAAGLDENAQREMAGPIEFMRHLREATGAAVCFVHHTGHQGSNMRGSSDLESVWESRLSWKRDGQSPLVEIDCEHREAEASETLQYRLGWDSETRSMRFELQREQGLPSLEDRIVAHLREHHNQRDEEIAKALQIRRSDVSSALSRLQEAGTTHRGSSGRTDAMGRPIRDKVWNLALTPELWLVPEGRTNQDDPSTVQRGSVARPTPLGVDEPDEPPAEPPMTHDRDARPWPVESGVADGENAARAHEADG